LTPSSEAPEFGDLTREQKELVDWFFIRLVNIYGSRFRTQFASEAQIVAAKIEWGEMICQHGREKLDAKLRHVKQSGHLDPDLKWPNIGYILGLSTGPSPTGVNTGAYLPHQPQIPDQSALDRARDRGAVELSRMRESLRDTSTECRKSTVDRRKRTGDRRESHPVPPQDARGGSLTENPGQGMPEAAAPSERDYGGFW